MAWEPRYTRSGVSPSPQLGSVHAHVHVRFIEPASRESREGGRRKGPHATGVRIIYGVPLGKSYPTTPCAKTGQSHLLHHAAQCTPRWVSSQMLQPEHLALSQVWELHHDAHVVGHIVGLVVAHPAQSVWSHVHALHHVGHVVD